MRSVTRRPFRAPRRVLSPLMRPDPLPGVLSRQISTRRISTHLRSCGQSGAIPVLFIHGNASSSAFWEETMLALPDRFCALAPDLRGYGGTEPLKIDASRGVSDWVDDILALLDALHLERVHVAGHSLGGVVALGLVAAAPERLLSVTLAAPGSPYGFGACKRDGTPCFPDGAGSGAGAVNPEFARRLAQGDRSADDPQASPRVVMNAFYWKPPFVPAREEDLLTSMLSEHTGPEQYPGDPLPSPHWPGFAPGRYGPVNALSPKNAGDLAQRVVDASPKPPVLWVRGEDDLIVSDASLFDIGTLGKMGIVPGWPGEDIFPPQPMIEQIRGVLDRYAANGGRYREIALPQTGHTPYIERPEAFRVAFFAHLG